MWHTSEVELALFEWVEVVEGVGYEVCCEMHLGEYAVDGAERALGIKIGGQGGYRKCASDWHNRFGLAMVVSHAQAQLLAKSCWRRKYPPSSHDSPLSTTACLLIFTH